MLLLGYLWALPVTVVGWCIALFGDARHVETDASWCRHYIATPGGRCHRWLVARDFGAFNCGAVIIWLDETQAQSVRLRRHEGEHYAQTRRWGLLWPVIYYGHSLLLRMQGRDPYRDNCFEVGARAAEQSASAAIIPNPE